MTSYASDETKYTAAGSAPAAPPNQEISLLEIVNAVLRNWRAILVLPLVLAFVAGLWNLNKKRYHAATATFVPQTAETRNLSGAMALAQQFGVSLATDRPGQSP